MSDFGTWVLWKDFLSVCLTTSPLKRTASIVVVSEPMPQLKTAHPSHGHWSQKRFLVIFNNTHPQPEPPSPIQYRLSPIHKNKLHEHCRNGWRRRLHHLPPHGRARRLRRPRNWEEKFCPPSWSSQGRRWDPWRGGGCIGNESQEGRGATIEEKQHQHKEQDCDIQPHDAKAMRKLLQKAFKEGKVGVDDNEVESNKE